MASATEPSFLVKGAFHGVPPTLTPAQSEAVMADDPVVCVVAGAGAGKTGVLTFRVARRAEDGSAPARRTLVCTFSRKAADELRSRLWRLGVSGVSAGTIHRIALRLLRDRHEQGASRAPSVLGDRGRLIVAVLGERATPQNVANLEGEIGWAKARLVTPGQYAAAVRDARRKVRLPATIVADLYEGYERERRRRGLLDLDDLLIEAAQAMEGDREFAEAIRWRHRHVLVDETQDLNPAQFRFLRSLLPERPDLFVVGDPSQSIYGWNGAEPGLLAELPALFADARVIRLDENHRSAPAIVTLASAALGAGTAAEATRPAGALPTLASHEDDAAEAHWVARQIWLARRPGRRWSHLAVLARTNAQLALVADALEAQRIPFTYAGRDLGPASDLGEPTGDGLLEERDDDPTDRAPADGVVLSTVHRAKGLQWPCVFVIGLSEGLMPLHSARTESALAEERRLLYVAMTRAQDELWCSWAQGDERGARRRCRWLDEVQAARDLLEEEEAPPSREAISAHVERLKALVS